MHYLITCILSAFSATALWAVTSGFEPKRTETVVDEKILHTDSSLQLKVMSYNIHHANPPHRPEEIDLPAIIQTIKAHDPDLLALQEVDKQVSRSDFQDQARQIAENLDMHYYYGKAIDFMEGEYGVAILSRFPLSEQQTQPLPTRQGSGGEPRVLATVKVALPDGSYLRFGSTHLDAQKSDENRLLQIREIVSIVFHEQLPIIIAGDFNAEAGSEVIQILDEYFQRTCQQCPATIPAHQPEKAIDFIAYSPEKAFSVIDHQSVRQPEASDHLPVVSTLQFDLP